MNNLIKNVAIWLVIALVLMTVFNQFSTRQTTQKAVEYSQFIEEVKQGRIAKVTIEGRVLKGIKRSGERFTTYSPSDPWLVSDLLKAGDGVLVVDNVYKQRWDLKGDPWRVEMWGDQIRGFGFDNSGASGTVSLFLSAPVFTLNATQRSQVERRRGLGAEGARDEPAGVAGVEGLDHELAQHPRAAQVGAQAVEVGVGDEPAEMGF